jgi:Ser/Thr protein kinase RdoA (MazF antagonist)
MNARSAIPTTDIVLAIVRGALGETALQVERFPTGLCHYVFDVVTDARPLVVRIAHPDSRDLLAGGVAWSRLLRPLGVPLPALLHADLDAPWPFMIIERLPGRDLGAVYGTLLRDQKRDLAGEIARIQQLVGGLPRGDGFGYATKPDQHLPHRSWRAVIEASLARSQDRIVAAGVVDVGHVGRVRDRILAFERYLASVEPRPFLDDTTTKNVLVDRGRLSGIVDVDAVCYGDLLWTVALTNMALLSGGHDTEYIDFWTDQLRLDATQRAVLRLYTAVFCVDFMSELGQRFNQDRVLPVDPLRVDRFLAILDDLLG